MKPYVRVAVAVSAAFAVCCTAVAAPPAEDAQSRAAANEAAGLPDLDAINRPAAEVSSTVEINVPRTPSFYEKSPNGTTITEYRDRFKPVQIDVHSNFGTNYQMTTSPDTSPKVNESNLPVTRLPSINMHY